MRDGQTTWDIVARLALSFSLTDASLSLSVCVQMSQTRHRAMAAPEITLAPGNVQELSRILQGRKRDIHRTSLFGRLTFFLSNNSKRLLLVRVKKILTTTTLEKKNEHLYHHHHHHRNCAKRRRSNRVLNGKASAWRRCTSCGKIWCT